MSNHFHLVIETPQANLVRGMKWLLGVYTSRFNRRHKLFGHLFSGRYKSLSVDGSGSGYLKTVCDYVKLNPVRARLIGEDQRLETYRWSSYPLYSWLPSRRPPWLLTDRLFVEASVPAIVEFFLMLSRQWIGFSSRGASACCRCRRRIVSSKRKEEPC